MPRPRPWLFLHLSLVLSASPFSNAVAQPAETRLLSSCSHCWPLSGVHPNSHMAPDGAGGVYVVWVDGSFRWRLQRLLADLTIPAPWPAAGFALANDRETRRIYPVLAADDSGGVYVAWAEQAADGDMSVWLLRLRSDGRPAPGWPDSGVVLTGPSPMVTYPALVRSGKGAAAAWIEARNGEAWIRLAALDADGRTLPRWPANGLSLKACECTLGDATLLASGGRGELFLAWAEMRERLADVKLSVVSERDGTARTSTLVTKAVPPHAIQLESHPELVSDGAGGVIVTWADERSQEGTSPRDLVDAFAQRLTSSGQEAWTSATRGGHPIAAGPGYQMNPHVVSDGNGGAFFSWNEQGPFTTASGRVQHLDDRGRTATGWPANGTALGLEIPGLIPDLEGGAFAMWSDSSGAYLQRFESGWSPKRGATAPFFLGPASGRSNVRITSDGRGGVFMAWEERGATDSKDDALRRLQLEVRIQHINLESGTASPIVQLPTRDEPGISFAVHLIAPNPARNGCRIAFDLPASGPVTVEVFDVAGRRITRVADKQVFQSGTQSVSWDLGDGHGRRVPSGLYLVRVMAGRNQGVARVTVVS